MGLIRVGKSESPHEMIEAGLRVLARIIAREALHDRRANVESANVALSSWDGVSAQIAEAGTDEKAPREEVGR